MKHRFMAALQSELCLNLNVFLCCCTPQFDVASATSAAIVTDTPHPHPTHPHPHPTSTTVSSAVTGCLLQFCYPYLCC